MRKAEGFNVFLKSWGYLSLISPELVALQLRPQARVKLLDFTELGIALLRRILCECPVVLVRFKLALCNAMQKEDNFLGEIGDVTAGLEMGSNAI